MSVEEYRVTCLRRRLVVLVGQNEGKHLALTYAAARKWGKLLHPGARYRIVAVSFTRAIADRLLKNWTSRNLDDVGDATFAPTEVLEDGIVALTVDDGDV
jgi:hypothetical protein